METKSNQVRQKYNKEFKAEAVKLVKKMGMSARQVGADLGVHSTLISRWVKEWEKNEQHAFPGKGKRDTRDEAVRKLEEEVHRLRMERDILKKAMAYFAKSPD